MDYKEIYNQWLENPYFDEATKEELKAIKDDENEIKERFYMLNWLVINPCHKAVFKCHPTVCLFKIIMTCI